MESERFDALIRRAAMESSRRGVLRAGVGALAASALGLLGLSAFEEAEAKKARAQRKKMRKQKARRQAKKKAKQGPAGPPGPPGPPGAPAPVVTCTGERPVTCGSGCCPANVPLCCDDVFESSGKRCHLAGRTCCPLALGGGSCRAGAPCCPPFKGEVVGDCAFDGEKCCPPESGSFCLVSDDCCPTATTNDDNGGCCPAGTGCCNVTADCDAGETCTFGCCEV